MCVISLRMLDRQGVTTAHHFRSQLLSSGTHRPLSSKIVFVSQRDHHKQNKKVENNKRVRCMLTDLHFLPVSFVYSIKGVSRTTTYDEAIDSCPPYRTDQSQNQKVKTRLFSLFCSSRQTGPVDGWGSFLFASSGAPL